MSGDFIMRIQNPELYITQLGAPDIADGELVLSIIETGVQKRVLVRVTDRLRTEIQDAAKQLNEPDKKPMLGGLMDDAVWSRIEKYSAMKLIQELNEARLSLHDRITEVEEYREHVTARFDRVWVRMNDHLARLAKIEDFIGNPEGVVCPGGESRPSGTEKSTTSSTGRESSGPEKSDSPSGAEGSASSST